MFQHRKTNGSMARCAALATLLGAVGLASTALAKPQAAERVARTLPPDVAANIMPTLPVAVDELRASYRPAADADSPSAGKKTLSYPIGVTIDSDGYVYVANLFGGITLYSPGLAYLEEFTAGVSFPVAVALSSNRNVYVANNGGNNITIYDPAHVQIQTITDRTLASPIGMYIDAADTVWVLDAGGTLHGYLNDGTFLPAVYTGGTAVGAWGPNVTVWGVTDSNGGYDERYQNFAEAVRYNPSLLYYFADSSPYAGGVAQDTDGQIFITDALHNKVQSLIVNGNLPFDVITTPAEPYGIAVDSVRNRIYVALPTLGEVAVYSLPNFKLIGTIH